MGNERRKPIKLTKIKVDSLKYEGDGSSRDVLWDAQTVGFGCRVYPSGKKSFIYSYRFQGRKRLLTIGPYGKFTVETARAKAKLFEAQIIEDTDPLETREKLSKAGTVKELANLYLDKYAKLEKRSWQDDERRINNRIIPAWGSHKAVSITEKDVESLHQRISIKHPYEANRVVELVSVIYEKARKWGFVPKTHVNPAKDVHRNEEYSRDRWVKPQELPFLAEAIDREENIYARYAMWLYLLTGLRKVELLRAKWSDVDWSQREIKIPETKTGKVLYLPLSAPTIELLNSIPKIDGNPYILPGLKPRSHLVNIDKPWRRIRDRATVNMWLQTEGEQTIRAIKSLSDKLQRPPTTTEVKSITSIEYSSGLLDVRLHDLRRTVGSWLAQAGNSLHLIGKVLNHSSESTTKVYARFGQDQVREALDQHADRIMGIAGKNEAAEVINFRRTKDIE